MGAAGRSYLCKPFRPAGPRRRGDRDAWSWGSAGSSTSASEPPSRARWTTGVGVARRRRPRRRRPRRASRAPAAPAASESSRCRFSRSSARTCSCASATIRRTSSSTSLCVSGEASLAPGRNGPDPSAGETAIGPIAWLIPQRPTICRASPVSCSMSDSAPVLISPKTISSAARPPSATLIFASISGWR